METLPAAPFGCVAVFFFTLVARSESLSGRQSEVKVNLAFLDHSVPNSTMATRHNLSQYLYPPSPECAQRVDEYLEELDKLYQQIEDWLPESAQTERTDTVFEFWDGHYSAPALNIRYGDISLRAIPAGISFGGGSLIYFVVPPEHRDSYPREVHILKNKDGTGWFDVRKIGGSNPKMYPFSQEGFHDLLNEIAAYS